MIKEVEKIRKSHPRMGGRKLYLKLAPFLAHHHIKIGRDKFFDLLSAYHLLIRKRKKNVRTTQSNHWYKKYTNQIKDFTPTAPNQLWVSDITYWKVLDGHVYISLITDAYSHKIVGYQLAPTLEAVESIQALKMALDSLDGPTGVLKPIHHSDRGVQYCSTDYVKLLDAYQLPISMTNDGDPLENAIAERANGILKEEYLDHCQPNSLQEAKALLAQVINLYNDDRPHMSISNLTPNQVHENQANVNVARLWKNYYPLKQDCSIIPAC
jgi:putative transposase